MARDEDRYRILSVTRLVLAGQDSPLPPTARPTPSTPPKPPGCSPTSSPAKADPPISNSVPRSPSASASSPNSTAPCSCTPNERTGGGHPLQCPPASRPDPQGMAGEGLM